MLNGVALMFLVNEAEKRMTILVGSDVPGLLNALEHALGGSQQLTVLHDAGAISAYVNDPHKRIDALILNDAIAAPANTDIATALWNITSYVARSRKPTIPTVLTLSDSTPLEIHEALRTEAQRTGGDGRLVPRSGREDDGSTVSWIIGQLQLTRLRHSYTIVGVGEAGGTGMTSTLINMSLQLVRLGLRVLLLEYAASGNSLDFLLGMQSERDLVFASATEPDLQKQVIHHQSGLDILFAPYESRNQPESTIPKLDVLIERLQRLNYDVICVDGLRDWKVRPDVTSLLARHSTSPLVVCSAGAKERIAALNTLVALEKIKCERAQTALNVTAVVFVEGEPGQITTINAVKRDVLQRHPVVTQLGILPRDSALLGVVAERSDFTSVFDLAPKRPYCHAIRHAVRSWMQAVELPPTWLIRPDLDERLPRKPFWKLRQPRQVTSSKTQKSALVTYSPEQEAASSLEESEIAQSSNDAVQPQHVESQTQDLFAKTELCDAPQDEIADQTSQGGQPLRTPALPEEFLPTSHGDAPDQKTVNTNWLDTARQHQRGRMLRASEPEHKE